MTKTALLGALLAPFLAVSAAMAQDCDPELFKGLVTDNVSDGRRMFYLEMIGVKEFEQRNNIAEIGAIFVTDGMPVKAFSSYEEFDKKRREEFRLRNFTYNEIYVRSFLRSDLSENGLAAYVSCLRGKTGLRAWFAPRSSKLTNVPIQIAFTAPSYSGPLIVRLEVTGVPKGVRKKYKIPISNGGETTVTIARDPNAVFTAQLNIGGDYTEFLEIPRAPKIVAREVVRPKSIHGNLTSNTTAHMVHQNPVPCVVPSPGWALMKDSGAVSPPKAGPPQYWGAMLHSNSPDRICFDVWISIDPSRDPNPASVAWSIEATEKRKIDYFE